MSGVGSRLQPFVDVPPQTGGNDSAAMQLKHYLQLTDRIYLLSLLEARRYWPGACLASECRWGVMPRGLGRLQRQLLEELEFLNVPLRTAALLQGHSRFEKRRALRRLITDGFVSEVRPDTWRLNEQARVRKRK